jgi:hypothetical protein
MYAPIPMVKAWPITPTSVAETMSSRPGPDGQPGMQWQLDAAQPWSPQGYVSKFWIPQTEEKPTLNQQYWAIFRRPQLPREGKSADAEWNYNWRIVEGAWNLTMENAMNGAVEMNKNAPSQTQAPQAPSMQTVLGGRQQLAPQSNNCQYTKDELIVRQVAGKIAGDMIVGQQIMPEHFAEWVERYYRIMMGYPEQGEEENADPVEAADVQQQGD